MDHLENGQVESTDQTDLKKLREEISTLTDLKSKLREDKTYAEASKNMLQDTGIKTKIIKQYLPIMNKLINTYLSSMEFYVNFTLNENFEENIKSRYRDDFTYESFSEGEKMRIDLALLFTWRAVAKMKNSTNTNLLILDEIFDSSLDGTGTDEFLKILNTLGDENVFVKSQTALADNSTIRFEKVKNFSHICSNKFMKSLRLQYDTKDNIEDPAGIGEHPELRLIVIIAHAEDKLGVIMKHFGYKI